MSIPYGWYTQNYTPTSFDESGRGIYEPMSEADWNKLPQNYQQQAINANPQGGQGFNDEDLNSRFYAQMGHHPGYERGIGTITPGTPNSHFVDPRRVYHDAGSGLDFTDAENYTPQSQNLDTGYFGERPWLTGIATVLGAGYLGGAFGNAGPLAGSLGEGAGGAGWMADGGFGAGGIAPEEGLTGSNWSGGINAGGFGPGGGLDPETWAANGPGGPDAGGLLGPSGSQFNTIDPLTPSRLPGMLPSGSSLMPAGFSLTDPSTWGPALMNNPLQALGLIQAGSGLLGGNKPSGSTGGSTDNSSKGGSRASGPVSRTPFQPNQFTQQQLQNYQPVIPRNGGY